MSIVVDIDCLTALATVPLAQNHGYAIVCPNSMFILSSIALGNDDDIGFRQYDDVHVKSPLPNAAVAPTHVA